MSEKKAKFESANSRCFLGPDFAAPILQLICSFFTTSERAKDVEHVSKHFKAASRHPVSFAGAMVQLTSVLDPVALTDWCRMYSSPPLRAVHFAALIQEDIPVNEELSLVLAAFGASLQTLRMSQFGLYASCITSVDVFGISRLKQLRHLQIPGTDFNNLKLLDSLENLESLVYLTSLVNLLGKIGKFKCIQRLKRLAVIYASALVDAERKWKKIDEDDDEFERTATQDVPDIRPIEFVPLPGLRRLWVEIPQKQLEMSETIVPKWIQRQVQGLKPEWLGQLCPGLESFKLDVSDSSSNAFRRTQDFAWFEFLQ